VLAADLDGDGRTELLCTTRDPGALYVWSAPSDAEAEAGAGPLPSEPAVHPTGAWPLEPLALPPGGFGAADGTRLVAVASRAERTVVLHDLVGGTPPREVWRGAGPLDVPRAFAAGDLGADGTLEIGVATDRHELYLIGESGTAVRRIAGDLPRCMTFLADGAGVVVGCQDTEALEVLGPDGPLATLQLEGIPRDLLEADVDFDGEPELVVVGGDRDVWAFGRGRGGASAAWLVPPGSDGSEPYPWYTHTVPIDVEAPDIRGDGRTELCMLHAYDLSYVLSGGWGDSQPEVFAEGYAGQTPTDCTLGDLDGDGRLDLAIANRDAQAVSMLLGDGRGRLYDAVQVDVGTAPSFVVAADLFGDALPEVVTLDSKSESITVLANRGGVLAPAFRLDESGPSPRAPVAAQLDGRGALELAYLVTDSDGARVAILAVDAAGALAPVCPPIPCGRSGSDLVALDLDGDGRAELICADADAGEVVVLGWAAGEPWSAAAPRRLAVPSAPRALALVELDGDPLPELAVALGAPGPRRGVALLDWKSEGSGGAGLVETAFLPADAWPIEAWPIDLVGANLDGRGGADLAVLALTEEGGADGVLLPLLSAAGGGFEPGTPVPTGLRPHHVVAADLDADGLDDLCVNAQNSHVVNAWVSRSQAPHLVRLDDLGVHLGPLDLTAADVDGDGILDLVVANSFSDDVSVLINLPR